jgi:hypothetical protein
VRKRQTQSGEIKCDAMGLSRRDKMGKYEDSDRRSHDDPTVKAQCTLFSTIVHRVDPKYLISPSPNWGRRAEAIADLVTGSCTTTLLWQSSYCKSPASPTHRTESVGGGGLGRSSRLGFPSYEMAQGEGQGPST